VNRRTILKAAAAVPTLFLPNVQAAPAFAASLGDAVRATDYPNLAAAVDAAKATAHRRVYLPAGDYTLRGTTGDILALNAPGLELIGDGKGKTRIVYANQVLTGNVRLLHITAPRVRVSGLTIEVTNIGGAYNVDGVVVGARGTDARVSSVECKGGYGVGTAGGSLFNVYQPSDVEGGYSRAIFEDCEARDAPPTCGFVINAQGSTFRDCRVLRCGDNPKRHGFYIQGGENTFENCRVEQVGGFSFHQYAAVPERAASFNTYDRCVSIDPGFQHFIATTINAGAINPDIPTGMPLDRMVTLIGCTFRRTKNGPLMYGGVGLSVPAIVQGCTFEDVLGKPGAWLGGGAGLVVNSNIFRQTNPQATTNQIGIVVSPGALVTGNQFSNWQAGTAIRIDGPSRVQGNTIDLAAGIGVMVNGPNATLKDTTFFVRGGTPIVRNVASGLDEVGTRCF
jgi:hypothetical protein